MTENQEAKKGVLQELVQPFIDFSKAPKALWGIYIPYILEGLAYFGVLTILGKFLSENVAIPDEYASLIYSFVTGGITLSMLFLGGYTDRIGIRRSLIISLTILTIGRTIISLSDSLDLTNGLWSPMFFLTIIGLFFVLLAYGFYQPASYAGIKRYSTPKTAAMGYAIIYSFMNLGAFFSGFVASFTRKESVDIFPPNGLGGVFWAYSLFTLIAVILTFVILTKKRDKEAYEIAKRETGVSEKEEAVKSVDENIDNRLFYGSFALAILFMVLFFLNLGGITNFIGQIELFTTFNLYNLMMITLGVIFLLTGSVDYIKKRPDHPFRDTRFVTFIVILIPVQTLFAHNWLTIPYYLDRTLTGTFVGEYFEVFSNLNPLIIFVITPIIAAMTIKSDVYKMMIYGTMVMALPTFLLVLGPNPYLFIAYIILMSIGEGMWQPRFLQWVAEIAPEGKTGAYMGIGQFPWFLTKVLTGFYSGWFVANYLPKPDSGMEARSSELWLYYSLIAMITPIALIMIKKWMMKDFKTKSAS